jgi:polar amino acid transport system substrate-binding protein
MKNTGKGSLGLAAAAVVVVAALAICVPRAGAADTFWGRESLPLFPPDIRSIKDRDTLIVAQYKGFRPGFFIYDDDNRYPGTSEYRCDGHRLVGYDVDLSYRIARELGVKLKFVRAYDDFNEVCRAVARGEADIAVSKLSVTYSRAQFVRYTVPYASFRMGFLINRVAESKAHRGPDILALCNHPDARIGAIQGTSFMDFGAALLPKARLVAYPDYAALFEAAKSGHVLASFYEEFEIEKCLRTNPDMRIFCRAQYIPGKEDKIAIAVNPTNSMLLSFLNLFLEREKIQPSVDEILTDYFPQEVFRDTTSVAAPKKNAAALLWPVIAFIAAAGLWLVFAAPTLRRSGTRGTQGGPRA